MPHITVKKKTAANLMVHRPSHHLNGPGGILKKCDTFFVGPPSLLSVLNDLSKVLFGTFSDNDK